VGYFLFHPTYVRGQVYLAVGQGNAAAFRKFRLYWSLVGPFSRLIRKAILKQVKTEAESILTEAS
jgi:hypothetical protein